ncbi:MAG: L,D-transpeptidase family protein [Pseudolabrys sp.]|jgi:murein L,D-transpeptidase YafK|nr:L,D-transpeptidase family protein [Pseudolabrys sp.]
MTRAMVASVALAAALMLAGCDTDGVVPSGRANAPLSDKMLSELKDKHMDVGSPILVRLFKEESELEVWKKNQDGEYALLKTYPICRWSGDLGPKVKEGDRQAPEGFYSITPGQMNPNSNYYLSFNTGYPNAYDRSLGHTGSELMVHGDCSSRGCYAMTDEQMVEIYALAREAFFGGQKAFQFQAYPFRMTARNMARHRNNSNLAFWKMLKVGSDHFEVTHQEPKVDVCDRRYVFDAAAPAGSTRPLSFSPSGKCPVYQVPTEIAQLVKEKEEKDGAEYNHLVAENIQLAPSHKGVDGGMNQVFLAKYEQPGSDNVYGGGPAIVPTPGALPRTASNPPAQTVLPARSYQVASADPAAPGPANVPVPEAAPQPKVGSAPQTTGIGGLIGSIFGNSDTQAPVVANVPEPEPRPAKRTAHARPPAKSATTQTAAAKTKSHVSWPATKPQVAAGNPPVKQTPPQPEVRTAYSGPAPTPVNSMLTGAQPVLPAGSFEARWSAIH